MAKLRQQDLEFVVRRVPADVRRLMRDFNLTLGGGFIRETIAGEKPNDIDLFGPDALTLQRASERLLLDWQGARLHTTENAITLLAPPRAPVQFITRWTFEDLSTVADSFDFTCCMAAVKLQFSATSDKVWTSECHPDFYADLAAKRLVYTHPQREEAAGGSMMRVRKFLARGYNIQAESLAGVIARLVGGVKNIENLDESQRVFVIKGLLHEVDPLLVVDGIEPVNDHGEL